MEKNQADTSKYIMEQDIIENKEKKLNWMYNGPNEMINREEYLLGKPVDKAFEDMAKEEKQTELNRIPKNHVEYECIPPSLRFFSGNEQVDLARKIQEDPLYAIKKKEIESRNQLLKNPVKLKHLKELLEQQSCKSKSRKEKKKSKYSGSDDEGKLDMLLASKYKRLKDDINEKDLLKLIREKRQKQKKKARKRSRDSESESDSNNDEDSFANEKRRKRQKKKDKRIISTSDSDSSDSSCSSENNARYVKEDNRKKQDKGRQRKKEKRIIRTNDSDSNDSSDGCSSENNAQYKEDNRKRQDKKPSRHYTKTDRKRQTKDKDRNKEHAQSQKHRKDYNTGYKQQQYEHENRHKNSPKSKYNDRRRYPAEKHNDVTISDNGKTLSTKSSSAFNADYIKLKENERRERWRSKPRLNLTEREKEQRRQEMMTNAMWHDKEREKNIRMHREEEKREVQHSKSYNKDFIRKQLIVATEMGTVASRIKSNINNIQRSGRAMDMNFAKR